MVCGGFVVSRALSNLTGHRDVILKAVLGCAPSMSTVTEQTSRMSKSSPRSLSWNSMILNGASLEFPIERFCR